MRNNTNNKGFNISSLIHYTNWLKLFYFPKNNTVDLINNNFGNKLILQLLNKFKDGLHIL